MLPDFHFERAIRLDRLLPDALGASALRAQHHWFAIGRLETGAAVLLSYQGMLGATTWMSPEQLGEPVRRKILRRFKEVLRDAPTPPAWLTVHDLQASDSRALTAGNKDAELISSAFLRDVWRAQYLGERDEDLVALAVPFAEKEAAKAAGARWNPELRGWCAKRTQDMSAFARWLPRELAADDGGAPVSMGDAARVSGSTAARGPAP